MVASDLLKETALKLFMKGTMIRSFRRVLCSKPSKSKKNTTTKEIFNRTAKIYK